jgi:hypothetical protein
VIVRVIVKDVEGIIIYFEAISQYLPGMTGK